MTDQDKPDLDRPDNENTAETLPPGVPDNGNPAEITDTFRKYPR